MDWPTVLISAAISALISTFFSLLVVSRSTVIQMRAQEREEAGSRLAEISRDLQRTLLVHEDSGNPRGLRDGTKVVIDDLPLARRVLEPAERLGWFRRRRVLQHVRNLFGEWTVKHARLMEDESSESAFASWIRAALKDGDAKSVAMGTWHAALSAPSESDEVQKALSDLQKLEGRFW